VKRVLVALVLPPALEAAEERDLGHRRALGGAMHRRRSRRSAATGAPCVLVSRLPSAPCGEASLFQQLLGAEVDLSKQEALQGYAARTDEDGRVEG